MVRSSKDASLIAGVLPCASRPGIARLPGDRPMDPRRAGRSAVGIRPRRGMTRVVMTAFAALFLAGCGSREWLAVPAGHRGKVASEPGLPFRLPAGYNATLVAGPPLITFPMFACFDTRGRLFVADSSGHNLDG